MKLSTKTALVTVVVIATNVTQGAELSTSHIQDLQIK